MDEDGNSLIETGNIDTPNEKKRQSYLIKEFELEKGERLIGMTSGTRNSTKGHHYDF
jgi:hypothetical protein